MKWIKSAGGPLVCIERDLVKLWMGVHGNSLDGSTDTQATDYERACEVATYVGKIQVGDRFAMILGDMPMETAVLNLPAKLPSIVRVVYKDPDADISGILSRFGSFYSVTAVETMPLQIASGEIVIFDSADLEIDTCGASIDLTIPPGHYEIRTLAFEPDERTAVVVHEFALTGVH